MDNAATTSRFDSSDAGSGELRAAPRFTLLIRAAKLITHHGEFVCVIRDVSETGISMRLFHALPDDEELELHMPGGGIYRIRPVWERDMEAGFEFAEQIAVEGLISEVGQYPKRGIRLGVCMPVQITTLQGMSNGIIENLSQQGARIECANLFAIDQTLRIESEGLGEIRAKVRWRHQQRHGVVFDDTFTLGDFARLAARLQAPMLLTD